MKKFPKWSGVLIGGMLLLLLLSLINIYFKSQERLTRIYDLPEETVLIPAEEESIARGKHIFQFRGCQACHSAGGHLSLLGSGQPSDAHLNLPSKDVPHMEGNIYLDDPAMGRVIASNLTPGLGGVGSVYTDPDWVRAIRHGVRPDGTPLLFMPSTEFYFLSDEDLGAVVAYIKSAPPVDNVLPRSELSFTGRVIISLVPGFTFIPAELIPHDAPRPVAPKEAITPEYGEYLTYSCKVCHGVHMSGGPIPGFPSSWPEAPNLTFGDGSALPSWTESGFLATIQTGTTPEERKLRGEYMPWGSYKFMTDDELKAVWLYLQSLPKMAYGNR